MIVARISRTMTYSTFGRVRRLSHTHSTMKAQADEHQHAADDDPSGSDSTTVAPNTTAASGTSVATSPATRAFDAHAIRERRQAERVVPGDSTEDAGDDVAGRPRRGAPRSSRGRVQEELAPAHVEQASRSRRRTPRSAIPGALVEHGRPIGAAERAEGPRLPQPGRLERPEQPHAVPRGLDRRTRDEHPDREQARADPEDHRDHERSPHDPGRARAGPRRRRTPGPSGPARRGAMNSSIVCRSRCHARRDADAALQEQPSRAGEEAADDRIRDEPDEVAQPEAFRARGTRRRSGASRRRSPRRRSGRPCRCSRTRRGPSSWRRPRAPPPPRPGRSRPRRGRPLATRGSRASARPPRGTGRCLGQELARGSRRTRARRSEIREDHLDDADHRRRRRPSGSTRSDPRCSDHRSPSATPRASKRPVPPGGSVPPGSRDAERPDGLV